MYGFFPSGTKQSGLCREVAVSGGSTVPKVEFHRPPKANESHRVSIKKTQDDATIIHLVDKKLSIHYRKQKKVLFEQALLLLKVINSCTKWVFSMIGQYEFSVSSEVVVCTRC